MVKSCSVKLIWLFILAVPVALAWGQVKRSEPDAQGWNRRVSGVGDYQVVVEVSGRVEVGQYLKRAISLELRENCDIRAEAVARAFSSSEGYLKSLLEAGDQRRLAMQIIQLQNEVAQLYAYRGEMAKSIEHFQAGYDLLTSNLARFPEYRQDRIYMDEILGVAWMRRGELENCVHHHNAETCIFPLSAAARHQHQQGSEKAIEYFLKHLAEKPDNLEVRWLLNVAAMTLGKYPQDVPREFLIPPAAFDSKIKMARFVDVASPLGIDPVSTAGGAIMDDFDNDGWNDIVISSVSTCEPMRYFHNNGGGRFSDWSEKTGLSTQLGGINCVQTDFNNDGRLDIFVMRGGWELPMRNSLLRQNADGTFTDVTIESGLASVEHSTHSAAWADYDNDGLLDLFVGHENSPSQLFRNRGDGKFEDVTRVAGIAFKAFTKGVAWGDYDNDGYPDLYASNYGEPNLLFHNNGNGTFTEVGKQLGVDRPIMSFPTWFFDYDNDGLLDLFVAGFIPSVAETAKGYLGMPPQTETMKLYRNTGRGFQDVTRLVGLDRVVMAMGANFGDLDSDGYLDFYLGTGAPSFAALIPNLMFRNLAGKRFVDVTQTTGTGHLQKGHGVAFGDLNGDGGEDFYVNIGGFVPGDSYNKVLFANPGSTNKKITVKLIGNKANRAAIGAKIKLTLVDAKGRKSIRYREVSSGGSFGASTLAQEIGLGAARKIDTLEVWWPAGGTRQTFRNVAVDQFIEITEGEENYRARPRRAFGWRGNSTGLTGF